MAALRRFETPPSKQAQVDWGHLGDLMAGAAHRIPDKAGHLLRTASAAGKRPGGVLFKITE